MMEKKVLLTICAFSLYATVAHAQSSVTLYGVIDEGIMFNNNATAAGLPAGGRRFYLDSLNGPYGSRWGLKGSEDLGGGARAIFTLESGVNLNSGALAQGGLEFGRQAFVGLSDTRYGTVTFGRQYDSVVNYAQAVTAAGYLAGEPFQHPGDLDNTANSLRTNNAIRYASPSFRGLTFGAELSLGGMPGNITGGGGYSAGAAYVNGPVTLGAAYLYFKNPTSSSAGVGFFTGNASGTQLTGILNKGYATASSYQVAIAGGTYVMGSARIGMSYSNIQYGGISALGGATASFNNVDAGVNWIITPFLYVGAAYDYTKGVNVAAANGQNVGNQHFNQFSLMVDYLLSKRTDVYVEGAYQKATGVSSTGAAAVADIGNAGDSSNSHQTLVRFGIRNKF
ncbi:porin [Paraburkholderia panacisoli]|uniref:Porin n=1 Tax=Paraburkholderia panacisoli TaxID=2603818 RepID=A0A5B0GL84_9BURK|nr:porin [Paraburkholderia panacisoli]